MTFIIFTVLLWILRIYNYMFLPSLLGLSEFQWAVCSASSTHRITILRFLLA